jgi:uncharacterized membrane protein
MSNEPALLQSRTLEEPVSRRVEAVSPVDRLTAVDALRGLVMVIMALDHTRDFFHRTAMDFSPEDLAHTTPAIFFTRWVTHICAPTFVFLAGTGAFLRLQRVGSKSGLAGFLLTRGLWLIVVELTIMRVAMNFTLDPQYPVLLLILWALGVSMIVLAILMYLPFPVLASVSAAIILLHNALDSVRPERFGAFGGLWRVLHQPGVFTIAGKPIVVGYPVLPWIGVMAAGFCAGRLLLDRPERRQRLLTTIGVVCIGAFAVLRAINLYGDPNRWSWQSTTSMTVVSFLRTTKYPPSMEFLLMTLGPSLAALAWFDRLRLRSMNPLVIIGRVPFFYYVVHFWMIHVAASIAAWISYGAASFAFLFSPLPSMGGTRRLFPQDFGYSLRVVYGVWIGIVLSMYLLCRWFSRIKARSHTWWLSYL